MYGRVHNIYKCAGHCLCPLPAINHLKLTATLWKEYYYCPQEKNWSTERVRSHSSEQENQTQRQAVWSKDPFLGSNTMLSHWREASSLYWASSAYQTLYSALFSALLYSLIFVIVQKGDIIPIFEKILTHSLSHNTNKWQIIRKVGWSRVIPSYQCGGQSNCFYLRKSSSIPLSLRVGWIQ